MKLKYISSLALALTFGFGLTSCEDFLDRPTEDNYNADIYYQNDEQCLAGTSYLYSSPWSDFTRNFINVGEMLSGNYYIGSSAYMDFTVNPGDSDLGQMSASLWAAVAHCNTVYNYIKAANGPSQAAKNQAMGECLVWKAVAYMFLVRSFGEIPIVHDNSASLNSGDYATMPKVQRRDAYDYIIMTLTKAAEILPEKPMQAGRFDKASAYGLLAKAYLSKAGITGSINTEDAENAVKAARLCLAQPGHGLMPNYSDLFRLQHNINEETLIAWRWNAKDMQWTDQSFMQSDYGTAGFSEFGDLWGDWKGMTTDLQEAFGIKVLEQTPDAWLYNNDTRLKATMMLPGFVYEYFWQDKGGFDFLRFTYDDTYNASAHDDDKTNDHLDLVCPTGAPPVKHLYGNAQDHIIGAGHSAAYMSSSLSTPILRLADVYLILAEAKYLMANASNPQSGSTTDPEALDAINAVRSRAGVAPLTTLTWQDIWKERRLELAFEGDRWYDFVRVSYYNPDYVITELSNQKRNCNSGLNELYYNYYKNGDWTVDPTWEYDSKTPTIGPANIKGLMKVGPESNKLYFALPLTAKDVEINPNFAPDVPAEHIDVYATYSY